MEFFRARPTGKPGHYDIVAVTDVTDPEGQVLYKGGETVPFSEVPSKTDAERHAIDLNHRYSNLPPSK